MIYVTGDCHGDFRRFNTKYFPEQKEMIKDDFIIICGDFGGVWDSSGESKKEKRWLNWLNEKPFTTLFIDGNHENFERLYRDYPVKEFCGGKVHEVRSSVFHLMRGEVFTLQGKKFFAFGGASCHDIQDGILDPVADKEKIKQWEKDYSKMFRVNRVSWWKEELPSQEECEHGIAVLKQHDNKVDFILTHCAPQTVAAVFSQGLYKPDLLTIYLNGIMEQAQYQKWFFGHYHDNQQVLGEFLMLYEQMIRIV